MPQEKIQLDFWHQRLEVNTRRAIYHQWDHLEASGCIENFRITAGITDGFREGLFFADSDAYKWLEAAVRIQAKQPDTRLGKLIDDFIELIRLAQMPDGYLFTYNQIFFPSVRWQNLQIEHELYCHGHLIEAGVSHYQETERISLLETARKAADRIVADFSGKGAEFSPGHEEIEIALLRLHEIIPGDTIYLDMASQFIQRRGRILNFAWSLLKQNLDVGKRDKYVRRKKRTYLATHTNFKPYQLPPGNRSIKPFNSVLRFYTSALSGKYFQQHAPVEEQTIPVGHCVRFAYLETAVAMLVRLSGDRKLLPALEQAWERMVTRRMYITGGIGSQPGLEGFGKDYELDPEYAYAETCAALGSLFWNWEMAQLTGEAKYSDLFEWQFYNAAAVGMGLDGTTYLYNNPLACRGGVERQPWYAIPCCPSNISRTWANLGRYIFSTQPGGLRFHQYISHRLHAEINAEDGKGQVTIAMEMDSGLPWEGNVRLKLTDVIVRNENSSNQLEFQFRQPSWSDRMRIGINGRFVIDKPGYDLGKNIPTSGYDPRPAIFQHVIHPWAFGDVVEIDFEMPIRLRHAHAKVKGYRGKVAVTRGPLVYCLEDIDNPDVNIFTAQPEMSSLEAIYDAELLGGVVKLIGRATDGVPLTFIPYFLWGNRGASKMTVWVIK